MIIGRKKEIDILNNALRDEYSHFVAIYGRRRVGKTFLIREVFNYRFTFQHAGLSEGGLKEQLFAFEASIKDAGIEPKKKSKNWLEAFELLKDVIRESSEKKNKNTFSFIKSYLFNFQDQEKNKKGNGTGVKNMTIDKQKLKNIRVNKSSADINCYSKKNKKM